MRTWRLVGPAGTVRESSTRGTLGGHRKTRVYGRMECPTALRALARGGYRAHRVFFADEATAVAAGYRPCARCLPAEYAAWRQTSRPGDGGRPQPPERSISSWTRFGV
jgi:hypothetical protein